MPNIKEWSYEQRLMQYNSEKRRWIRNHPDATASETDDAIRRLERKFRI